ncbi:MAG: hypothetical protein OQJ78_08840 [Ignavibacteriaceae bacterium]|jgi:hypothetical protein|nr:hypothetical protein [Ignavibacteriaceae bacterium]
MGFSVLMDILGATIIGGILMLNLFEINNAAIENNYTGSGELTAQQNLAVTVQVLEHDFRKIGYCANWQKIPIPTLAILAADSSSIKFLTDVDSDGNVDTMYYYLGPTSELLSTPNPRDRILYRVINSKDPFGVNLGVTQFNLTFFDVLGNLINFPITVPGEIYTMQIDITVEDVAAYNEQYSSAFWRQIRLVAKNLRNR